MQLDAQQLEGRPKRVGKRGETPVLEVRTKGGFHLIVSPRGSSFETLGTGPHKCVARHIAEKHAKNIVWTDLNKSDWISPQHYEWMLPRWEAITQRFRAAQGD